MSNIIVQMPMGDCCLCREPLSNGKPTVTIREKGAKNINEYSKLRNDSLCVEPGQTLHQDFRREYTNMNSFKGAQQPKAEIRVLRSKEQFTYKDNCLFVDSKPVKLILVKGVSMYFQCELRTSRSTSKKYAESEMTAGQLMFYQGFSLYRIFMQQTQFITRNVASTSAPEKVFHPQHQIRRRPQVDLLNRTFRLPFRRPWII
jgi:hypothetical protein